MNTKEYLNKIIEIKIDRPLGSTHPKHKFYYPVNYGYVENTISGDGEELDAYLLGVFDPVDTFKGKVADKNVKAVEYIYEKCIE